MIKFVDLKTENVFSGSNPYVHWFEGEQSTDLIYVKPVCFVVEHGPAYHNRVTVECDSDTFALLDPGAVKEISANGFQYTDINSMTRTKVDIEGTVFREYGEKVITHQDTVYIAYFKASSPIAAEVIDEFTITYPISSREGLVTTTTETFNIGADFYGSDETLQINAMNMGINIPPSIQRSIYPCNVHEEKNDNILINRKFKELLSNYWDTIACKGSYKSLINTFKWFEYGDDVRLREVWKHDDNGKEIFDDREISTILTDKYQFASSLFSKTTYYAIYCALQHEHSEALDREKNPVLENAVLKWAYEDMAIKMSLLGNFYETYFMPIYLDIIQSTIEDTVFTDNVKLITGTETHEDDLVMLSDAFDCIVNNGRDIILSNIEAGVGYGTIFANRYSESWEDYNVDIMGANYLSSIIYAGNTEDDAKTTYAQLYSGPGAIVSIECRFGLDDTEVISNGKLIYYDNDGNVSSVAVEEGLSRKMYMSDVDGKYTILFYILVKDPTKHIGLQFISSKGRMFTKDITIRAREISSVGIHTYKAVPITSAEDIEAAKEGTIRTGRYPCITRANDIDINKYYCQYISDEHTDIRFSNVFALEYLDENDPDRSGVANDIIDLGYNIAPRTHYDVFIAPIGVYDKDIFELADKVLLDKIKSHLYFNRMTFIPQYYKLIPLEVVEAEEGTFEERRDKTLESITISKDLICVEPYVVVSRTDIEDVVEPLSYSLSPAEASWEFVNVTAGRSYELNESINTPYVLPTRDRDVRLSPYIKYDFSLKDGFYDIVFRYKLLSGGNNTIRKRSAFVKKT